MALTTPTTDPPDVVTGAPARRRSRRRARGWGTTVAMLRAVRALLVSVCLVAGGIGVYSARARVDATTEIDRRAGPLSADTIDLYRSLAAADAAVAGEFLVSSGGDPTGARQAYDGEIRRATESLAHANTLVDEEGLAARGLATITRELLRYTELVGEARALGGRTGLASLREASALMQSTILRPAEALQRTESRHLDAEYRRAASVPTLALASGLLALVALICVQVALFRRTRRILNVGLVASSALVVGALLWSVLAVSAARGHLDGARRHSESVTDALGLAHIAALQARADEMLTLAVPGDVEPYETDFAAKIQILARDDGAGGALGAARRLADDTASRRRVEHAVDATRQWVAAHRRVNDLRKEGRTPEAVNSALDGSSARAFRALEKALGDAVSEEDAAFARGIRRADASLAGLVAGTGVLALTAAAAAVWGIGRRLEEYR